MDWVTSSDDTLQRFWEIEEAPSDRSSLSVEEHVVVCHFETNNCRSREGRFVVPLPKNPKMGAVGESRAQAVRRFLSLERSLNLKSRFQESICYARIPGTQTCQDCPYSRFGEITLSHILSANACCLQGNKYYRIRAVFDTSAKSSTGVSLNDTLLVGPIIHPSLIDVLL